MGEGKAAVLRRDRLYKDDGKLAISLHAARRICRAGVGVARRNPDRVCFAEAKSGLEANIRRDVTDLAAHFKGDDKFAGWVEVQWAQPTGAALDKIVEQLKALKLTMRNTPLDAAPADGTCFFTGEPAVERILIGRTY